MLRLVLTVTHEGQGTRQHCFDARSVMIGRVAENDIVLDDPAVSRFHAEISHEDGAYFLNDLGSANGSACNGEPVDRRRLCSGDIVRIGDHELRVHFPSCDAEPRLTGTDDRDLTIRARD